MLVAMAARQSPSEHAHKQPIQNHVQYAAHHRKSGAQSGFANCDKAELEHHAEHGKGERDQYRDHILPAIVQQRVVRPQKAAQGIQKDKTEQRQHHTEGEGHRHHQGEILAGFVALALADLFGDQGVAAAAEHHSQRRRQKGHRHGDVDGGQGIRIDPAGNEDTVHGGIQIGKNAG